jgi:cell division protein FtsA
LVVGLDIGSTKVCAAIGERGENGTIEITGVGLCPSTGVKKGVVVNIEATLRAVREAVESAQMMSGRDVDSCWTGIGGSHIDGINSRGVVAVTGKDRELREIGGDDIARVLEAARAVVIPMDRQVLEVIPQSYIVDDHKGIKDPLDMIGVRLEAEVHIITCSVTSAQNLIKCVNRAGYYVKDLILQSLAAGRAALTREEKDLGVALVDIGGGTTEMLVYCDGVPYSTVTIPFGGNHVTGDISFVKNISFETAERIKIDEGACVEGMDDNDDDIIVPGVGGRAPMPIPRSQILTIIQPRMEEIFKMAKEKLGKISRPLGAGIVLTGGGSQLLGAAELAFRIFEMPVRVGSPIPGGVLSGGLVEEYRNPVYSTAIGLVLEGFERQTKQGAERSGEGRPREKGPPDFLQRFKDWLGKEFF